MMWEFFLPLSRFCVISAPGITSIPYSRSAARPLELDIGQIVLELVLDDPEAPLAERGHPADVGQQVLLHQDVIGDRDHVELAGLAVKVHHLAHW